MMDHDDAEAGPWRRIRIWPKQKQGLVNGYEKPWMMSQSETTFRSLGVEVDARGKSSQYCLFSAGARLQLRIVNYQQMNLQMLPRCSDLSHRAVGQLAKEETQSETSYSRSFASLPQQVGSCSVRMIEVRGCFADKGGMPDWVALLCCSRYGSHCYHSGHGYSSKDGSYSKASAASCLADEHRTFVDPQDVGAHSQFVDATANLPPPPFAAVAAAR